MCVAVPRIFFCSCEKQTRPTDANVATDGGSGENGSE